MAKLEQQLHELIDIATLRMAEYFRMEHALQRIADLDPKGDTCPTSCECIGCIAREALPK